MALLKPPGGGREKPWHQDKAYFNLTLDTPVVGQLRRVSHMFRAVERLRIGWANHSQHGTPRVRFLLGTHYETPSAYDGGP